MQRLLKETTTAHELADSNRESLDRGDCQHEVGRRARSVKKAQTTETFVDAHAELSLLKT
jgi:hypothetical protein